MLPGVPSALVCSSTRPQLRAGQREPQTGAENTGLRAAAGAPGATWGCRHLLPTDSRGPCHPDQVQASEAPTLPRKCLPHVPPPGFLCKVLQDVEFGRSSGSELHGASEDGSSSSSCKPLFDCAWAFCGQESKLSVLQPTPRRSTAQPSHETSSEDSTAENLQWTPATNYITSNNLLCLKDCNTAFLSTGFLPHFFNPSPHTSMLNSFQLSHCTSQMLLFWLVALFFYM
ncbi:uncharacterized protein LOC116097615 [Mastomys coucha]|uniref:uncharacterized protein LOC116097615 n=1 Tax=Mastomys coucha TaxID=35658 RepID=UPI0012620A10|nr:uncharacterized protein LOC116097615 [Mastomys coucha]